MAKFKKDESAWEPDPIERLEAAVELDQGSEFLAKLQAQAIMEGLSELEYADLLIDAPMLADLDEATAIERTPEQIAAFDAFSQATTDEIKHKIAECKLLHGADWKRHFDAWCRGEKIEDET